MFVSVESAYEEIGKCLLSKAVPGWSALRTVCPILNKGCGGITTVQDGPGGEVAMPLGTAIFALQDACLFLREDLLRTTGNRIWGLTFTLYSDGKFNIEYDYNKPEGYDETEETVDIAQSLEDLQRQGIDVSKK
jgi:hypothetical protein